MPRDVSLSDSECWNGGHEWILIKVLRSSPETYPASHSSIKIAGACFTTGKGMIIFLLICSILPVAMSPLIYMSQSNEIENV